MKNEFDDRKESPAVLVDNREQTVPLGRNVPPAGTLTALLKTPGTVVAAIRDEDNLWKRAAWLIFWGLAFHSIYGFVMALFGGWEAGLMTLAKAPVITLSAMILCLPSLYVFSSIGGSPISVPQCFAIVGSVVSMTGLMLLGMVPVAWLFSISTDNIPFVVLLNTGIWLLAVLFARRFLKLVLPGPPRKTGGFQWWLLVYIIVSLQMATTMRPLLLKPADGWRDRGKKFFLAHFIDSFKSPRQEMSGGRRMSD